MLATDPNTEKRTLALLTTSDVESLLGPGPYFGQGQHPGESSTEVLPILEAARFHGPRVVFLGLEERDPTTASALPSSDFKEPEVAVANIDGTPYFSVDVADLEEGKVDEVVENSALAKSGAKLAFTDPRTAMGALDVFAAGVFAGARSMVDWNDRNKARPTHRFLLIISTHFSDIVLPCVWFPIIFSLGRLEAFMYHLVTMGR